jgi:hypothetical protein
MNLPQMVRIRQEFNTNPIGNIAETVQAELAKIKIQDTIRAGDSVAITAGSRGIANLADILAAIVKNLKDIGAEPFIFPAMGSHGGATADGQAKLLDHYGVNEQNMGVPIKSSMEVVQVSTTEDGINVFVDKNAADADHIIVLNRVKPHTDFKGEIESGLFKMMAIGMGKQQGADYYHNLAVRKGHYPVFLSIGREVLKRCNIACGIALVENQRDETEIIQAIPADSIEQEERKLLQRAKQMFPQIPLDPIDLLIVDWMGKEISGTGMDQNVIGRSVIPYHNPEKAIQIMRIFIRDLTDDSDGNATAIGNADFTTRRLVDKIDPGATYMNAITSSCPEAVRIPPYFDTDRQAVEAALKTIGEVAPEKARIVHIRNTLMLEEMNISETMVAEAENSEAVSIIGSPKPLTFDANDNLVSDV